MSNSSWSPEQILEIIDAIDNRSSSVLNLTLEYPTTTATNPKAIYRAGEVKFKAKTPTGTPCGVFSKRSLELELIYQKQRKAKLYTCERCSNEKPKAQTTFVTDKSTQMRYWFCNQCLAELKETNENELVTP